MVHYIVGILAAILYTPLFKILYNPVLTGIKKGPRGIFEAFGAPWVDVPDYTHAYFIFPISLWMLFRKRIYLREHIRNQPPKRVMDVFSFTIFLFGILMLIFNLRQDDIFLSTLSLIPFLYGLIIYLYGTKIAKALSFPILYLLFLVPPPLVILDSITLPMRQGISVITETILKFFGYPITREGLLLSIGYKEIFLGPPCSGFRSLITMLALVLVYVHVSKKSISKKFVLASFIIPFAVLGNLTRVIALCLITFYFGEEAGQGFFHNFSGITIFVFTILGVLGVEVFLDRKFKTKANSPQSIE